MTSPSDPAAFLRACDELGYRPLRQGHGYLAACVKPEHAERFAGCGCDVRWYAPEAYSNPERQAAEVTWRRRPVVIPHRHVEPEAEPGREAKLGDAA